MAGFEPARTKALVGRNLDRPFVSVGVVRHVIDENNLDDVCAILLAVANAVVRQSELRANAGRWRRSTRTIWPGRNSRAHAGSHSSDDARRARKRRRHGEHHRSTATMAQWRASTGTCSEHASARVQGRSARHLPVRLELQDNGDRGNREVAPTDGAGRVGLVKAASLMAAQGERHTALDKAF